MPGRQRVRDAATIRTVRDKFTVGAYELRPGRRSFRKLRAERGTYSASPIHTFVKIQTPKFVSMSGGVFPFPPEFHNGAGIDVGCIAYFSWELIARASYCFNNQRRMMF